jgi:hypothetical protein
MIAPPGGISGGLAIGLPAETGADWFFLGINDTAEIVIVPSELVVGVGGGAGGCAHRAR